MNKYIIGFLFFTAFVLNAVAQSTENWKVQMQPAKVFIENKGQFKVPGTDEEVLFAVDHAEQSVFFTRTGVYYTLLKQWREKESEKERELEKKKKFISAEEHRKHEEEEHHVESDWDIASFKWENANSSVVIEGLDATADYHSYAVKTPSNILRNINHVRAFKKIIYRNLYPGIDVEYEFHPVEGIKYSVILNPDADVSKLQMLYDKNIRIENSNLLIPTKFGNITDHAPLTFYADSKNEVINSQFVKNGNTVSFQLSDYDHNRTVIIDPWVQSPTFGSTTWHCVWECEKDAAGNVYIIGGGASQVAGSQMKLMKYNSTGTIQWTYTTPYDTSNCWLGTFATDNAGNSYVTAGSVAQIQKIDNNGNLVWNNANPGGVFSGAEFWNIVFNCDQSKLVIGGTGGPIFGLEAVIYNVDVATGNITSQASVAVGPMSSFPPNLQEVRSISSCQNGKYYFLTHDTIGYINQNFALCPSGSSTLYKIDNGVDFGYKCEDYRFDNSGIMGIRADANFVYVNKGNQIQKRDLNTLAVLASATITGGALNNVFLGGNNVSNSGIDIDVCGNIYVGSKNQVVKFDQNLNQVATYTCSFNVYDVHVNANGDVIASGSTGTSSTSNRSGFIQSFSAAACATLSLTCCDATICIPGAKCISDAPFNLTAATAGGTWSGTGITNASTGTFDPSVAGVGTHTVTYSLACGNQSITITVNSCQALSVCVESNGDLTVSGTGPFSWYQQSTSQDCSACTFGCNFPPGCAVNVTTWSSFANGSTINPSSGSYPMYVVNSAGDSAYIANSSGLPACSACNLTPQLLSQTNVSCAGGNNGSATVNATGGSGSNTYSWAPSGGTAATASGLAAGTYTCTITNGACTTTQSVTITQPTAISTSTASTNASCGTANGSATVNASGGSGSLTYSWTPGGLTTSTISNLSAGTYSCTVTDANSCTVAVTVVVNNSGGPTVSLTSQTNATCNGGSDGAAVINASGGSGTYTYTWTPSGGNAASATGLNAGTYTVSVDDGSCISTQTVTITEPAAITTSTASTNASCGSANGSATVNASGGTGTLSYLWNPGGQTTSTISNLSGGTYTCVVTDASACTQSVTVVVGSSGGATATLQSQTNVSCNGGNNGAATVSVSGGTGTISYNWLPSGGTAATASTLSAGTYTCTVTDGAGCSTTQTVTITEPTAITTSTASTNSACGSGTGSASVTASGGAGSFTYAWSPGGGNTATINNISAGTYTCVITDANACTQSVTVVVNSNGGATVSLQSQTNITCNGSNNGSATITATGGTGTLTYNWQPSGGTAASASNLSAGTYTCVVTDAAGCVSSQTVTITQPTAISSTPTSTNAGCGQSNGTASANASGGTGALTYSWQPGGATTATASNLSAGTYTCTITDANLCSVTATVAVTNNGGPVAVASANGPLCAGGTLQLSASGGTTYSWTGPGGFTSTQQNPSVSNISTALNGTYTVVVSSSGCTSTATVSVVIAPGPTVSVSADPQTIYEGESTVLTASGGVTYSWSGTGNTATSITVVPTNTGTTTYCVYGANAQGCLDSACVNIEVKILDCGDIHVPTAFSPNGDKANDEFCLYGAQCVSEMVFSVFDRWGEKVFESTDPSLCWDGTYKGKALFSQVFGYILKAKLKSGEEVVKKGNVSLIK